MQHNVKIIALAGKAGYGKTTISKMIMELDPKSSVTAFAAPLKDMVRAIFPQLTDYHLKDQTGKMEKTVLLNDHSPRELMQFFGTDFVRKFDPDLWVKRAAEKIELHRRPAGRGRPKLNYLIFDDCRFENEVNLIRQYDGCIIHLERDAPELPLVDRLMATAKAKLGIGVEGHASEAGVRKFFQPDFDYVINTSEPMTTTYARVKNMVSQGFSPNYQL